MKGWHNDSARHSLAARGMKTKHSPKKAYTPVGAIKKVYHSTYSSRVPLILKEGLKPSLEGYGGNIVWFWERKSDAEAWARMHGQDAILEVDWDKDIYRGNIVARGVRYSKKTIPPNRIRRVM